jgi:hypothetical protein
MATTTLTRPPTVAELDEALKVLHARRFAHRNTGEALEGYELRDLYAQADELLDKRLEASKKGRRK